MWQIKNVISPLSQDLWIPNLAVLWLKMSEPIHKVARHFDHVVKWQIKNVISPHLQGAWPQNLVRSWLRMRGLHPKTHVTLRSCSHMTVQKRDISSTIGPTAPKLNRVLVILWLLHRGLRRRKLANPGISFFLSFVKKSICQTLKKPSRCKEKLVLGNDKHKDAN